MNRVTAGAAALATAAATIAAVATNMPAMAASRPVAADSAARAAAIVRATTAPERAKLAAGQSSIPGLSTANIAAESDGGKYLTVVHCSGVDTPPPIRVGAPGTPLTASGVGPSAGLLKMLSKPNPYKTVYTCTVAIELEAQTKAAQARKAAKPTCELGTGTGTGTGTGIGSGHGGKAAVCHKPVTLNTGFGGMASQVASHHPAG